MATFHLGPQAGRAEVATRVRLHGSQRVLAIAQLSDGSFWSGSAEVEVTESACLDAYLTWLREFSCRQRRSAAR